MSSSRVALAVALACAAGCRTPDPRQELELLELETYWALDPSVQQTQYMAPVARLRLRNKGRQELRHVQATAAFKRRGGESETWGTDFKQLASTAQPLLPGQEALVVLKSDARYYSTGSPESMFAHKLFKDARVEVFVRVGSSDWAKLGEADVERRIGTKSLQTPAP